MNKNKLLLPCMLVIILFCFGCGQSGTESQTHMPIGWTLEQSADGKYWRWVKPGGGTWMPLLSRERAIENAWEHYNYNEPEWVKSK